MAGIQHDGPLITRCAQLCGGRRQQGPDGHAGGADFGAELRVAVIGGRVWGTGAGVIRG